jgi:hypothetical protein
MVVCEMKKIKNRRSVRMVGSALKKFDFVIIDSLKLIFVKIDLKLKYFMFGYIYAKMNGTKNLSMKPMFIWFMSN